MFTGKERLRQEKENWEWFQVPWERRDSSSEAKAIRNLRAREVTLIGGTLDESPEVYKDINKVMAGQTDLVDILAKFEPKVVRMAEEKAQWTQRRNKKKAAVEAEVCM